MRKHKRKNKLNKYIQCNLQIMKNIVSFSCTVLFACAIFLGYLVFAKDKIHIHPHLTPDVTNKHVILTLANMSSNAYHHLGSSSWLETPDWEPIDDIGYSEHSNGIRGHIYKHHTEKIITVSFKGTSTSFFGINWGPTSEMDKLNDNLMFGCCGTIEQDCTKYNRSNNSFECFKSCLTDDMKLDKSQRNPRYYINNLQEILPEIQKVYPNHQVWFTGHSLGGALAALAASITGNSAVTFESPPLKRFTTWNNLQNVKNVYNFGVYDDPIFMGECNGFSSSCFYAGYTMDTKCHIGNKCTLDKPPDFPFQVPNQQFSNQQLVFQNDQDPIETENIFQHRINYFINQVELEGLPKCNPVSLDCDDCEEYHLIL